MYCYVGRNPALSGDNFTVFRAVEFRLFIICFPHFNFRFSSDAFTDWKLFVTNKLCFIMLSTYKQKPFTKNRTKMDQQKFEKISVELIMLMI